MKLATGIEPVTSSLPMRCATDCATPAFANESAMMFPRYKIKFYQRMA